MLSLCAPSDMKSIETTLVTERDVQFRAQYVQQQIFQVHQERIRTSAISIKLLSRTAVSSSEATSVITIYV